MDALSAFLLLLITSSAGVVMVKLHAQQKLDRQHKTYRVVSFPYETDVDQLAGWVHAITGTLRPGWFQLGPSPTVVFEVVGDKHGITHRLKVPWRHEYVIHQLHSHVPGIRLEPEEDAAAPSWKQAVEIRLAHMNRPLGIRSPEQMWNTIRGSLQGGLKDNERVLMQWVATPAIPTDLPQHDKAQTTDPRLHQIFGRDLKASRDEVNERRKKLEEPNVLAVLRLAADAQTSVRARHLLDDVRKGVASARGTKSHFGKRVISTERVIQRISETRTPLVFPIKLSLTEFVSLIGWPIGSSLKPGIATSMSRHLPPAAIIPSTGRVIGSSNAYGAQRDIAISYDSATRHVHCVGRTGVGKTTLLVNMAIQDMQNGHGVIIIEAKDDLFNQALKYIPRSRLGDVIILDVNDNLHPVGFNIFDQGNSRTAIDELCVLIDAMYKDVSQSLNAPQMLYHLTHALAEVPGTTFMDLPVMMTPAPRDSSQGAWRDHVARQVKDPYVSNYLQAFLNMKPAEQDRLAAPLYKQTWEFMSRPEIRAILGQRTSSFKMRDVIEQNKILLVSLSGSRVGPKTAAIAGTLLVNSIWQAVRQVTPDKPNFLYLDEFADFINLPVDIESILAKARSAKLGMVLAHQNLSQVPPLLRDGVMANTATKIVFRLSARDAGLMVREFGGYLDERDLLGLPQYEAVAMVATDTGSSPPVSIETRPLPKPAGTAKQATRQSRQTYGRPIKDVERELTTYTLSEPQPRRRRPQISGGDVEVV